MEKVKVTEQHLRELKIWNDNNNKFSSFILGVGRRTGTYENLYKLTPEQFALLLCDWYEVEPEYFENDLVVYKLDGKIYEVYQVPSVDRVHLRNGVRCIKTVANVPVNEIRYATQEEIKQEKERRRWAKIGRNVNDYKTADVVTCDNVKGLWEVMGCAGDNSTITNNFADSEIHVKTNLLKMVCPVENRMDVSEE